MKRSTVAATTAATACGLILITTYHGQLNPYAEPQEAPSPPAAATAPARPGTRTLTGPVEPTGPWGTIQVRVVLDGDHIVDVLAEQYPLAQHADSFHSTYEPPLRESALRHGDGTVDTLSGATDTSDGYRASLHAALAQR